jgi:TRAP-type C4-dicarboxylate transport system permease small subunit
MPKLIKLYIVNVAYGFALSVIFFGMLLWLDVAGIRHLIFGSSMGPVAAFMMIMMNGVVFAGVQFAIAVMRLAEDPEEPPRGKRQPVHLVPIKVTAAKVAGPQRP